MVDAKRGNRMDHRNRRLFFLVTWGVIEWFFLYGTVFYGIVNGLTPLAWILGFAAIVSPILGVIAWFKVGESSQIRWLKGSWTTRRIQLGLGLFLVLEVAVLIFQLTQAVRLHRVTQLPFSAFSIVGRISLPLGGIVLLLIGLLWSLRKGKSASENL
jgi:hypothetical protein